MLPDPIRLPAGWTDLRVVPADQTARIRGCEELAAYVRAGLLGPTDPVLVCTREVGERGLPPVRVAVPLTPAEARALRYGDRSTAKDVVAALEAAYTDFMAQVQRNEVE